MANAFGVTHRTLHFYEEKNLIAAGRSASCVSITASRRPDGDHHCLPRNPHAVAVIQELKEALDRAHSQEDADNLFLHASRRAAAELDGRAIDHAAPDCIASTISSSRPAAFPTMPMTISRLQF